MYVGAQVCVGGRSVCVCVRMCVHTCVHVHVCVFKLREPKAVLISRVEEACTGSLMSLMGVGV